MEMSRSYPEKPDPGLGEAAAPGLVGARGRTGPLNSRMVSFGVGEHSRQRRGGMTVSFRVTGRSGEPQTGRGVGGGPDSHIEAVRRRQQPPLGDQHGPAAVLPAPQPQAHLPRPLPAARGAAAHDPGQSCHWRQAAVCWGRGRGRGSAGGRTGPPPHSHLSGGYASKSLGTPKATAQEDLAASHCANLSAQTNTTVEETRCFQKGAARAPFSPSRGALTHPIPTARFPALEPIFRPFSSTVPPPSRRKSRLSPL